MRNIARSAAVLGATAVAAMALVSAARPALAAPAAPRVVSPHDYECAVYQESDYSADAYCGGTTTVSFRIEIFCTDSKTRYGTWKTSGAGQTSYATCPTNTFYIDGIVETE
jgi:hypothetical protein